MHFDKQPKHLIRIARKLRANLSLPEALLWKRLKSSANKEFYIERQRPVLGRFVVDFFYADLQIAFEIDGKEYHLDRTVEDSERQSQIEATGIAFVRIPASWVLQDPDEVAQFVLDICAGIIKLDELDEKFR